jgi:hypothetical protein
MTAHRAGRSLAGAGTTVHLAGWKSPGSRYLEFAGCGGRAGETPPGAILAGRPGPTQLAGTGEDRRAAILHAQRPTGALRIWWSPVPLTNSENVRPVGRLTIEATIQL